MNFLDAAETDADFRGEIPAFVAKIKTIFERWQLVQYLETAERPNRSIQAYSSRDSIRFLAKRKSNSSPRRLRTCGRTTSGNALVICCWWSRRGSGCWTTRNNGEL